VLLSRARCTSMKPPGARAGQRALGDPGDERGRDSRVDGIAAGLEHLRAGPRSQRMSTRDRPSHAERLDPLPPARQLRRNEGGSSSSSGAVSALTRLRVGLGGESTGARRP
jgi:hypothetical protein